MDLFNTQRWLIRAIAFVAMASVLPSSITVSAFGIPDFLEFGECPPTKNVQDLDLYKFSGVWFSQEMVPNDYTDIVSCSMTNYTWRANVMKVVEKGLNVDGRKVRQISTIRPDADGEEGEFVVDKAGAPSAPFHIVATDYENYACIHSCLAFMGFRAAFSWVYTRQPVADPSYAVLCKDLLAEKSIDPTPLEPMKQGMDCPYKNKLDEIMTYNDNLLSKAKAKAKSTQKKSKATKEASATPATTFVEEIQHLEEVEERLLEEEARLAHEMAEEKRLQEEEMKRLEDERRRMEEERQMEEEERRRMEEERELMEEERTRLEEERRRTESERREDERELTDLRHDVRAEIRKNHRENRLKSDRSEKKADNSSSHQTVSSALILSIILSARIFH